MLKSTSKLERAVLCHAGRVQPSQGRVGGLICREEALNAQLVKRNVIGCPECRQRCEELQVRITFLHFNRQERCGRRREGRL